MTAMPICAAEALDWRALRVAALAVDCGCHRAPMPLDPAHIDGVLGWPAGAAQGALERLTALRLIATQAQGQRTDWRLTPEGLDALATLARPLAPLFSAPARGIA